MKTSSIAPKWLFRKLSNLSISKDYGSEVTQFITIGNSFNIVKLIIEPCVPFIKRTKLLYRSSSDGKLAGAILKELPELEIYNSSFTSNFGEWALGFCAGIYGKDNPVNADQAHTSLHTVSSLDLSNRNIHNLKNKVEQFLMLIFLYAFYILFFVTCVSLDNTRDFDALFP